MQLHILTHDLSNRCLPQPLLLIIPTTVPVRYIYLLRSEFGTVGDSPLSISPYCLYRRTQPLILPGDILSGFKCIPLPANTTIINYGHVTVQFLFAITSIGIRTVYNIIQFITDR